MGLEKKGVSLNLTLVISSLLVLLLIPFVFPAIIKTSPVSITPSTENSIETQLGTESIVIDGPLVEVSQSCVSPPQSMISWWPGDANANDIMDGNDGSLINGATFTTGMVGQAFSFDGVDDYVEVPDNPSLNITEKITIDAWINVSDIITPHVILSKYFGDGYYLRIDPGGIVSFYGRQSIQSDPLILIYHNH